MDDLLRGKRAVALLYLRRTTAGRVATGVEPPRDRLPGAGRSWSAPGPSAPSSPARPRWRAGSTDAVGVAPARSGGLPPRIDLRQGAARACTAPCGDAERRQCEG